MEKRKFNPYHCLSTLSAMVVENKSLRETVSFLEDQVRTLEYQLYPSDESIEPDHDLIDDILDGSDRGEDGLGLEEFGDDDELLEEERNHHVKPSSKPVLTEPIATKSGKKKRKSQPQRQHQEIQGDRSPESEDMEPIQTTSNKHHAKSSKSSSTSKPHAKSSSKSSSSASNKKKKTSNGASSSSHKKRSKPVESPQHSEEEVENNNNNNNAGSASEEEEERVAPTRKRKKPVPIEILLGLGGYMLEESGTVLQTIEEQTYNELESLYKEDEHDRKKKNRGMIRNRVVARMILTRVQEDMDSLWEACKADLGQDEVQQDANKVSVYLDWQARISAIKDQLNELKMLKTINIHQTLHPFVQEVCSLREEIMERTAGEEQPEQNGGDVEEPEPESEQPDQPEETQPIEEDDTQQELVDQELEEQAMDRLDEPIPSDLLSPVF